MPHTRYLKSSSSFAAAINHLSQATSLSFICSILHFLLACLASAVLTSSFPPFSISNLRNHGHPSNEKLRYSTRAAGQYYQPPRKLLCKILSVPCPDVAAAELCCCRRKFHFFSSTCAVTLDGLKGFSRSVSYFGVGSHSQALSDQISKEANQPKTTSEFHQWPSLLDCSVFGPSLEAYC